MLVGYIAQNTESKEVINVEFIKKKHRNEDVRLGVVVVPVGLSLAAPQKGRDSARLKEQG